jgi:hypothetical protein
MEMCSITPISCLKGIKRAIFLPAADQLAYLLDSDQLADIRINKTSKNLLGMSKHI